MIALLAWSAHAGPSVEVLGGWSGTSSGSYSYVQVQPSLVETDGTRLMLRGIASLVRASWLEGDELARIEAPGLSLGPALAHAHGDLALNVGVAVGGRRSTSWLGDEQRGTTRSLDTFLTGEAFWRPQQRAQLYSQFSFAAIGHFLWARAGATYPVTPRERPVALWLGLEGTTSGVLPTLATEVGPLLEVPVAPLKGSLALRAATPVGDLADGRLLSDRTSYGLAFYWAY